MEKDSSALPLDLQTKDATTLIPNAEPKGVLLEIEEMKAHPERYRRYSFFLKP